MEIKQFDIWLANLNPARGTEPGKTRPVVILQTDLLNNIHPSTLICPVTSQVIPEANFLRVHLKKGPLDKASDILVDQIRALDNSRLVQRLGKLNKDQIKLFKRNILSILDFH